jgi:hypothetical protein
MKADRWRERRRSLAVSLVALQLAGCYTYVPIGTARPQPGSRVAVSITDRGRVALTEPVGPGARRLEGDLVEATDSSIVMAVSSVRYLDLGVPARWAGQRVALRPDHIGDFRERRLSRTRTWLALGLAAVGVVATAFIAVDGFGGDDVPDRPDPGTGPQQSIFSGAPFNFRTGAILWDTRSY